jgi:chromosome segregation ATPase
MGSGDITKEYDKLDRILAELAEHRVILNGLANNVASIETRLSSLEERVEKKLLETKPIWVAELNGRIDELSGKVDGLSARIDAQRDEMEKGFQLLSGRLDALAIHLNENEGRQRVLDRRVTELERAS